MKVRVLIGMCLVLEGKEIDPVDVTERFNIQRKDNMLYEDSLESKSKGLSQEILQEEKKIDRLEEKIEKLQDTPKNLPCFKVEKISFHSSFGEFKKSFGFLDGVVKKYLHSCLNQNHLSVILTELKLEAIKRGYITTLFALKAQNLKSGELIIEVETSLVGKIAIKNPSEIAFWGKDFGIKEGDVLNVEPLERGIYNYKRLRTILPKFYIQAYPSEEEVAQTQIDIAFDTKKLGSMKMPFYLSASVDNGGNQGSGFYQTSLQMGLENVLALGEAISSYTVLTPYWKDNRHSFYTSLDVSIPFRRFLLSVNGSYSFYAYPLKFVVGAFKYHGYSGNLDIKGKILAYMDNLNQFSISFGLGKRWAKNFLESVELVTQRRNLTNVYLSLDYLRYFQNSASLSLSLGVKQGVKFLGAMENFPTSDKNPPDFFYTLPTFDASAYVPFALGEHKIVYSAFIKTQVSRTQLYASEKMGLGGIYSVRGFDSSVLSGDFGILNRNDLTYYPPSLWGFVIAPSLGVDMGYVADLFSPASFRLGNKGFVSGGGVGLKMQYGEFFQAQIWGYMPFYNPHKQKERNFYFSIGGGF